MNTVFPTLYKLSSTKAVVEWTIAVEGNVIRTRWGQKGGKIQETTDTISEGKNIGKSNETTPEQQALAEAEAQFQKKLKKDYVRTIVEASSGSKSSEMIEGGILPMLAHRFDKYPDRLVYPCFAQPKLDGHRCIAVFDAKGACTLWSRTRKKINSCPHIVESLKQFKLKNFVLDGELYNHDYKNKFEELTHFIRQSKPIAGAEVVQYHVYDCAVASKAYSERYSLLRDINWKCAPGIVLVDTILSETEDELMDAFEHFRKEGYEGAIARNTFGLYVNTRSYDLLKIKEMDDSEFKCVGVEEGRGKLTGCAIFSCVTSKGDRFNCKMTGNISDLRKYYEDPSLVVGKMVTVQHQGMSTAGIPRFPVALRIRQDV